MKKEIPVKRTSGFTIIEFMIAITILSLVIAAIYSTWTSIVKGSKIGLEAAASTQRARIAMRSVADALLTAQLYTENSRYYAFMVDTASDPDFAWMSVVSRLPSSFPGDGCAREQFRGQAIRRVTFSVQPGTNASHRLENQLVMTQSTLLTPTNFPDAFYSIVLARDVSLFTLEFQATNSAEWVTEWVSTNRLPARVRIMMGLGRSPTGAVRPEDLAACEVALQATSVPSEIQIPPAVRAPAGRGTVPGGPVPGRPGAIGPTPGAPPTRGPQSTPLNPSRGGPR